MSLLFRDPEAGPPGYPTGRIQKGLVLALDGVDLVEEGLGFGVPLLKFGPETVFPGGATLRTGRDGDKMVVRVDFDLNLVERVGVLGGRGARSGAFRRARGFFSGLHREYPPLRGAIALAAGGLRFALGMESRFEEVASMGTANVVYTIRPREGIINTSVDLSDLKRDGCTEIIVANEQGASFFDRYRDSSGAAREGREIGTWDETGAQEASLIDPRHGIAFTLGRLPGARMFRGRELAVGRLAWSGLNYALPPGTAGFAYDIGIGASS